MTENERKRYHTPGECLVSKTKRDMSARGWRRTMRSTALLDQAGVEWERAPSSATDLLPGFGEKQLNIEVEWARSLKKRPSDHATLCGAQRITNGVWCPEWVEALACQFPKGLDAAVMARLLRRARGDAKFTRAVSTACMLREKRALHDLSFSESSVD